MRGPGDSRAFIGDVYAIRENDADSFPALCKRLSVHEEICDAVGKGISAYFSAGRGSVLRLGYSRSVDFHFEVANGSDSVRIQAYGKNIKALTLQKAQDCNLSISDAEILLDAVRKTEASLSHLFKQEKSHVVYLKRREG